MHPLRQTSSIQFFTQAPPHCKTYCSTLPPDIRALGNRTCFVPNSAEILDRQGKSPRPEGPERLF